MLLVTLASSSLTGFLRAPPQQVAISNLLLTLIGTESFTSQLQAIGGRFRCASERKLSEVNEELYSEVQGSSTEVFKETENKAVHM
jgi:hypothetical protein